MTRTVSQDSPEWAVWTQNAIAFIRSKGLEVEFSDWCGGWPVPVVEGENCKRGGDEPQANAPSITLPDDLLSLSEAATQGEWDVTEPRDDLASFMRDERGDCIATFSSYTGDARIDRAARRANAKLAARAVNFIRALAAKQGGKS